MRRSLTAGLSGLSLAMATALLIPIPEGHAGTRPGPSRPATAVESAPRSAVDSAPASSVKSPPTSSAGSPLTSCERPGSTRPGTAVATWRMGAVHFTSAEDGIGLTDGAFFCHHQTATGDELVPVTTTPQLAVTRDGGRQWRLTGTPLPDGAPGSGDQAEQVLTSGAGRLTVLDSQGRVYSTGNAGQTWHAEALPASVVQIAAAGDRRFALISQHDGARTQTSLERDSGLGWQQLKLPGSVTDTPNTVTLTVISPTELAVDASGASGALQLSRNAGSSWSEVREPSWDGQRCDREPTQLAAAGRSDWWLLCLGEGAAGSDTKGLLATSDAGRHWHLVSGIADLNSPVPGGIPLAAPVALAAGSPTRLWLSLENGLSVSADGGAHWATGDQVNPEGNLTSFDVLSARTAWLLAPGAGLWHTSDGATWTAEGALNTL